MTPSRTKFTTHTHGAQSGNTPQRWGLEAKEALVAIAHGEAQHKQDLSKICRVVLSLEDRSLAKGFEQAIDNRPAAMAALGVREPLRRECRHGLVKPCDFEVRWVQTHPPSSGRVLSEAPLQPFGVIAGKIQHQPFEAFDVELITARQRFGGCASQQIFDGADQRVDGVGLLACFC